MILSQDCLEDELKECWNECGYTQKITQSFLKEIEQALSEQGLNVNIQIASDDNQYDEN